MQVLIIKITLGLGFLAAADFRPLDVKTGEWESSMTVSTSDLPPIPVEALAQMTPEQRARIEQQTKSLSGRTVLHKFCLKKEKLNTPLTWGNNDKACTNTLVNSTASMQEIHVECTRNSSKSSGTMRFESLDSEHIKGTVKMTITNSTGNMDINSAFTAKWLGDTCTPGN